MRPSFLVAVLCVFIIACAQGPTTVSESDLSLLNRSFEFEKTNRPLNITSETVVLDTRAFFDYQISRLPGALFVDANDFSLRRAYGSDLQNKAVKMSRRLALMGINPFSHVVVVGYGDRGQGEEGIVALSLLALGIERVQIGTLYNFKSQVTNKQSPVRPNQRYWEPRIVSSVVCPAHPSEVTFVIELGRKLQTPAQALATLNKNWKDFVNKDDFSPNYKVQSQLKADKVDANARLMVRGPQAALVVFNLLQMGYTQACMMHD